MPAPIQAREKIEENLVRLDRLSGLGLLAAGAAHEIKNALVASKAFVDLLLDKHQDSELAEIVRRELHRIDAIVGQILHYSSPAPRTVGPVDVHDVLDHSLRLIQPQLDGKEIVLRQNLHASQLMVNGDQFQLQQAFVNLLLNAIQAMGGSGTLTVQTKNPPAVRDGRAQIELIISDTGVGIPPENQSRMFEPFFTTKTKGTGLGLSITHQIVREHGGSISVQSELHKGSSFFLTLPLLEFGL